MADAHDRRGFFRELIRGAAQAAEDVGSLVGPEELQADTELYAPAVDETGLRQETVPAVAAERLAPADELRELSADLGLETWAEEAAALALPSIRLTRGGDGSSRLGGQPDVPAGFEWPLWEDDELQFIAQVRLDDLPETPLPPRGTLIVFFALSPAPSGLRPSDGGACRVLHVGNESLERAERDGALPELPFVPSMELTLPLEPSSPTAGVAEIEAWTQLRDRLAALQGVELEDRTADYHAIHRLLGYPDALAGGMELDAQLVGNGVDLTSAERYADPRIEELQPGAADWRLLFQLSSDDDLGVALGYYGRLYVWIRTDDLRAGRFEDIRAFVR